MIHNFPSPLSIYFQRFTASPPTSLSTDDAHIRRVPPPNSQTMEAAATAAAAVVLAVVETMRSGAGDNEEQDWSREGARRARCRPRTPWNLARRQQQQGERGAPPPPAAKFANDVPRHPPPSLPRPRSPPPGCTPLLPPPFRVQQTALRPADCTRCRRRRGRQRGERV